MSWLTLKQAANMLDCPLIGDDAGFEVVSTDSRQLADDSLFFALKGPNFDAHNVLDEQVDLPLAGVVVSRSVKHAAPSILVDDTQIALGAFAAAWRKQYAGTVVGVTGSNGKTTVKEMIASIFQQRGAVLATEGNLNNEIGLPLTVCRLRDQHQRAVLEMGANHAGEIAYLTGIARPDIAVITNAGPAHLEGFGSVKGVAKAKGEIFSGLSENGIAVINADDPYSDYWKSLNPARKIVTFGFSETADFRVLDSVEFELSSHGAAKSVSLQFEGRHNRLNAAAAAAVASAAGMTVDEIIEGLESASPAAGRLEVLRGINGSMLIDDSYNANPGSLRAAIEVLAAKSGRKILVVGELAELGDVDDSVFVELGRFAREAGIDAVLSCGEAVHPISNAFGEGGAQYPNVAVLIEAIKPQLDDETVVLVKGSRVARMERVIQAFGEKPQETDHAV